MQQALEKDLFLDIGEKSRKKIINVFKLAKATQLPVIEGEQVVGILDLFEFLQSPGRNVNIAEVMEREITVAGAERDKFIFDDSNQYILPFVDERGRYIGFINRLFQKCYLPSKEYMQVVERKAGASKGTELGEVEYDELVDRFDAIIESNYDGIYITADKGVTLSINDDCEYFQGVTADNVQLDGERVRMDFGEVESQPVNVAQNIQKRNEVSLSDDNVSDGGIVRIINNLQSIKKELQDARQLSEKYKDELAFLRWRQKNEDNIIANSEGMKKVINLAVRVANVESTVLILGQSGVGKEVISRLIHKNSMRKDEALIKIDCGSIPEHLLESELFGYEPGAFTGANKGGKVGLVELANGGTLFLDEIGELPLNLQTKILRMLQDREIMRVGSGEVIKIDIRVIAATNRDLAEMVAEGTFRQDLYYRLNVVPIRIPPLAERWEDVKPLIQNCLNRFNEKYGFKKVIEPGALKVLMDYPWPGNVRELENIVEYLVVTSSGEEITRDLIPDTILATTSGSRITIDNLTSLKDAMNQVERSLLMESMQKAKSTEEMAAMLKLDRSTVIRKLQKHQIKTNF